MSAIATSRPGCCPTTAHVPITALRRHGAFRRRGRNRPGHRGLRGGRLGAGAAVGPGRLAGDRAGRRAVLGPGRRLGRRRGGLAHLYWTEPRVDTGTDPVPLGSNNSGRGVGGSMVHYAGYTPRFHPSDFPPGPGTGWAPTGRSNMPSCGPTTSRSSRNCPSPGNTGPGVTRTANPIGRTRWAATVDLPARRPGAGHHSQGGPGGHHQRPVRQPSPLHLSRFLSAGLQGQRQGVTAHTHFPTRSHTAPRYAPTRWRPASVDANRPRSRRGVLRDGSNASNGRPWLVAGYSIETPRLLLNSACERFPEGVCNDFDQVRRYLMVQGAPQTAGRFDPEIRVTRPRLPRSDRTVLRNSAAPSAGVLHPERLALTNHMG